jgi:WD40 repeat protein
MHGDGVLSVAFSPDGRRVVTASEDATAMIWDATTGAALTPPLKHANQVTKAGFNADGKVVTTICRDGNVRLWSAQTGEPLTPPLKHLATPWEVNLLQDGRHLLTRVSPAEAWLSQFPDVSQPVQDLKGLVYLLTSEPALVDLKPGALQSTPFGPIWDGLRTKYPSDFVTTPAEVIRWHEMELEIANAMGQSNAADFHLQLLPALR